MKFLHAFYKDEQILLYLLNTLQSDTEINPTYAGYFVKACDMLIMVNPERFLTVLFENQLEQGLFKHLYTSSMSDLLVKVIIYISEFSQFISHFVSMLNQAMEMIRCQDLFVSTLASQVIQKVILSTFDRLYSVYLSKEFLSELLKGIQTHEGFIVKAKLKIFLNVLQKNGNRQDLIVVSVLGVLVPAIETILDENLKGLNETGLLVIDILKHACGLGSEMCNSVLGKSLVFEKILGLVEKYPWSTMLHNGFLAIFRIIIWNNPALTQFLLVEVRIQDFIIKYGNDPYVQLNKVKVRAGFVAQLFVLANDLQKLSQTDDHVTQILLSTKGWIDFTSDKLKWQNQIESKQLGHSDNTFLEDSNSSNSLLSEDELKDFELIDEKNDEEIGNYDVIGESCTNPSDNKENEVLVYTKEKQEIRENFFSGYNKEIEQLLAIGNSLVEKILSEALQELSSKPWQAPPTEYLFTPVTYWKLEIPIYTLEDL